MPRKKLTEEEEIARVKAMYEYEQNCRDNGYTVVAGVDEAGRGPLAGPVYAAAVILPNDIIIKGINDSKKLSEKKREELFEEITEKAIAYNIFSVDEKRIDEINILNATYEAMKSISIAAASILAKVSRDRFICQMAEKYPEYGFEKHKGYGTKAHNEAILKYGPCPIHRRTFLRKLLGE